MTSDWKSNTDTIKFYAEVQKCIEEVVERILNDGSKTIDEIASNYKYHQGMLAAYTSITQILEDIPQEESDQGGN